VKKTDIEGPSTTTTAFPIKADPHIETSCLSKRRGHAFYLPGLTGDGREMNVAASNNKRARLYIQGLPSMLLSTASRIDAGEMTRTVSDEKYKTTLTSWWDTDKTKAAECDDECSVSSSIFGCPLE
jgi:hypothetical protein